MGGQGWVWNDDDSGGGQCGGLYGAGAGAGAGGKVGQGLRVGEGEKQQLPASRLRWTPDPQPTLRCSQTARQAIRDGFCIYLSIYLCV